MFTSALNERSRSNPLCDFRLGTVVTSDYETPLTGYEPKKDLNLTNAEELDLATTSDIYWQHTLDEDASFNDPDVDDNQLAKYLAVVVDRTGKPVEMRSNNDQFSCDIRNLKSAQSQFLVVTQPEMICQTGGSVQARIAEERESSQAQIRTMLDEQRRTIIAEYSEKVLHHELLAHREHADYRNPEGVSVSQSSLSVVFDRTGKPVGERNIDQSIGFGVTRNTYSAHSKFSEITQAEKMVDRTWKLVGESSSNAQIRTLFNEQRRTIIAECCEKIGHHELFAAHAEQDRKVLQEELLRQQQDFREVQQQDLMKHLELQKFQNSAFDEFTQKKFIEDQKTIMLLSGRLQELQNEVNFMNDSKDFMDAESICSGNPHVTSPPGLFPRHPPFEGMLRPSFSSQRQNEEPPNIWDTSGTSGNVFAHPQASSSAPYPQELNSTWKKNTEEPIHMSIAEKSGRPERDSDLRCQSGPSAKNSVIFSGGDSSKNYGADQQRLQISDLHFDNSLHQLRLLAGR